MMRASSAPEITLAPGQHVYLAGTGKWWTGQHFGAVIVDVREEDATVKVKFTDGGFKRFKVDEFRTMCVERPQALEVVEEWHSVLPKEEASELNVLHDEIVSATREGDTDRAELLREMYQAKSHKKDALDALQVKLRDAVNRGDYLVAHQVQVELNQMEGRPASQHCAPTPAPSSSAAGPVPTQDSSSELKEALQQGAVRALGGGVAGAGAMVLQVFSLMWLRTTMNYQYRHGLPMVKTIQLLYADGGILRFYRGIGPALLQAPLARFTDTAANAGVLATFEGTQAKGWPIWVKTIFASSSAALVRIGLVPLDTLKTVMQVEGKEGFMLLARKYRSGGASTLFHGAAATSAATFVSHYPWFCVFNTLDQALPYYSDRKMRVVRNAGIGLCASIVSDTVANSFRVVKTCRQTRATLSYRGIVQDVIASDGYLGLFSRGLKTRIITNGCSGMVFATMYKLLEEEMARR